MTWPLTKSDAVEARNNATPISSFGSPQRPAGVRAATHLLNSASDHSASLSGVLK
jgi:hypothetical protein